MTLNSVLAQQELKSGHLENQSKTISMLKGLPRVRGMKWNRKDVIIEAKLCLDIDIERVHRVKRRKKKGSANANVLSSRLKATRTSSKKSPKRKARWFSLRDQ